MVPIHQLLNPVTTAQTHAGSSQGASSLSHSSAPIHSHPDTFLEHHLSKSTLRNLEARLTTSDTEEIGDLVNQALEAIKKGEMTRQSNDGLEARYSTKDGLAVETRFTGQVEAGEPAYDFLSIHPKSGTGQPVYLDASSSFAAAPEPGPSDPERALARGQLSRAMAGPSSLEALMRPPSTSEAGRVMNPHPAHEQGASATAHQAGPAMDPRPDPGSKKRADITDMEKFMYESTPHGKKKVRTQDEIRQALRKAGFTVNKELLSRTHVKAVAKEKQELEAQVQALMDGQEVQPGLKKLQELAQTEGIPMARNAIREVWVSAGLRASQEKATEQHESAS